MKTGSFPLIAKCTLLVVLALVVKGLFIAETGIGTDECFSVFAAQLSVGEIISLLQTGDNPPLWELLLHFWIKWVGNGEAAIRIPSLFFNALTVIPIFLIGEKYMAKNVGLAASLLFIFSCFSLFIAHEARVYSLVGFLSIWSVYLFLSILRTPNHKALYVWLTLVNVLIIYSHYLGAWTLVMQGIWFLIHRKNRQELGMGYVLHVLAVIVFFLPFVPTIYLRFLDSGVNGTWIKTVSGIEGLYNMIWTFSNAPLVTVVFIIGIVLAALKQVLKESHAASTVPFINLSFWFPLLVSFLVSFKVGFFLDRYFYFLLPLFTLVVSMSFNSLGQLLPKYGKLVVFVPVAFMLASFNIHSNNMKHSGFHKQTQAVAIKVNEFIADEGTLVVIHPEWYDKELVYYADRQMFSSHLQEWDKPSVFKTPLAEQNVLMTGPAFDLHVSDSFNQVVFVDLNSQYVAKYEEVLQRLSGDFQYDTEFRIADRMFYVYTSKP